MKKIIILFLILSPIFSYGQDNIFYLKDKKGNYLITENDLSKNEIFASGIDASKYYSVGVADMIDNLFLITIKKYEHDEYPIAYYVIDKNKLKQYKQTIPKVINGKTTTIIMAKFNSSGDSILFHDTIVDGNFTVSQKIYLGNGN